MVHRSSLCHEDLTMRHFVVASTSVRRARVHSVVLLCSICRNLYRTRSTRGQALIFCFHLKDTAAESYRLVRQVYGEHAPSIDACER